MSQPQPRAVTVERLRSLLLAGLLAGAQSVSAQAVLEPTTCWSGGEPAALALARSCQAHTGCAMALARQPACLAAQRFIDRLARAQGGETRIDNNRVITAAMPELRDIGGLRSEVAKVERQVQNALDQQPQRPGTSLRTRTGTAMFYEGQIRDNLPNGIGALIIANGATMRGNFVDGRLTGLG